MAQNKPESVIASTLLPKTTKKVKVAPKPSHPLENRGSLEPWIKDDITFYSHQVEGIKWMKDKKGALLADEMGCGKTLSALAVFGMHLWRMHRIDSSKECSLLVIAPSTIKENWAEEIEKFTRLPYVVLDGTEIERTHQLFRFDQIRSHKILVIHYEQVAPHLDLLNYLNFSMLIADEAHNVKNYRSKRTKAFQGLDIPRRFMLTGTPILRHVDDLWVLLDTISPGQWGSYWSFTHRYMVYGGYRNKAIMGIKNEQHLITKLNEVMLRRTKDETLDLPDIQYIPRTVRLTERQRDIYNYIVSEMKLDRENGSEPEPILNHVVKQIRLRQICATTATILSSGEDTSSKLDLAEDDAKEIIDNGHKLIVFTQFRAVIEAYNKRLNKKLGEDVPIFQIHGDVPKNIRFKIVKEWSEYDGPAVIIGIIKTMGIGLNMTAAKHCQFIDKEYSPALNDQAVGRLHRIGADTTQSIQVLEYLVRNSAESRVEKIIKEKRITNDIIINNSDQDFERRVKEALEKRI